MSKNKMFNVTLNNGKMVTVQLDKTDETYDVQGGGSGYNTIQDIQKCKFLNDDAPEARGWVRSKKKTNN